MISKLTNKEQEISCNGEKVERGGNTKQRGNIYQVPSKLPLPVAQMSKMDCYVFQGGQQEWNECYLFHLNTHISVSTESSYSFLLHTQCCSHAHADSAGIYMVSMLWSTAKWGNNLHFNLLICSLFVKLSRLPLANLSACRTPFQLPP